MEITDYTLQYDNTPWRLFKPTKANKDWRVLWLQGFTSTIEGHSEGVIRLAEATKTPFAMLNYAGHGNHPIALDDATREQQFKEVLSVYDELVRLGYKKIITIGGSFGGYMAALLASKRPLEVLVLRAPATIPKMSLGWRTMTPLRGERIKVIIFIVKVLMRATRTMPLRAYRILKVKFTLLSMKKMKL